ncbi:MAG: hypothetical protein AB7O60_10765 [Variibacter sp.]
MKKPKDQFLVGVDIGKSQDHTAIAIVHHTITPNRIEEPGYDPPIYREEMVQRLDLVHLQRLPLQMNYVAQSHAIREILAREPLASGKTKVIADSSGVGEGVLDLMQAQGLRMARIKITGGSETTQTGGDRFNVAKSALISKLEAAMHSRELQVAASLKEADNFKAELMNFERKVTAAGQNTWSARGSESDDIVLAVSYAIWWASSGPIWTFSELPI